MKFKKLNMVFLIGLSFSISCSSGKKAKKLKAQEDLRKIGVAKELLKKDLTKNTASQICNLDVGVKEDALLLKDVPVKKWSIHTLRALGCLKVKNLDVLLKVVSFLESKKGEMRSAAEWVLTELKPRDEKIISTLLELIKKGNYPAASTLSSIKVKNKETLLVLSKLLLSASPRVRAHSVMALGYSAPKEEVHQISIVRMLKDPEEKVQQLAAEALGYIKPKNKKVKRRIKLLLKSKSSFVREAAGYALTLMRSKKKVDFRKFKE